MPAMVPIEIAAETVVLRSAVALRRAVVTRILGIDRGERRWLKIEESRSSEIYQA